MHADILQTNKNGLVLQSTYRIFFNKIKDKTKRPMKRFHSKLTWIGNKNFKEIIHSF